MSTSAEHEIVHEPSMAKNLVEERLGNLYGPPKRLDHRNRPLRPDREMDDFVEDC